MHPKINPRPETISSETISNIQQTRIGTSAPSSATFPSTDSEMDIRPITYPLAIVERLRGMFVDLPNRQREIGFIPDEVAEVVPEAVVCHENGKDMRIVEYSRLVAVLIEAVKEQQVQIKNQEHSLREQKGQVARLRAEIERLKVSIRATPAR